MNFLLVAAGSAAGGVTRWVVGEALQRRFDLWLPRTTFHPLPIGTLVVNVSGSFLLGALTVMLARQGGSGHAMRLLLAVGFCGGYTTFSTFSSEMLTLLDDGAPALAAAYLVGSVALALLATYCGVLSMRALLGQGDA